MIYRFVIIFLISTLLTSCATHTLTGRLPASVKSCLTSFDKLLSYDDELSLAKYRLTQKQRDIFINQLTSLKKRDSLYNDAHIDSKNRYHLLSSEYMISEPNQSDYSRIKVAGRPFKDGGQYWINYKVVSAIDENKTDVVILKQMPWKFFHAQIKNSFFHKHLNFGDLIILPSNKKGRRKSMHYEPWQTVEFLNGKTKLQNFNGDIKYISNEEIIFHNFTLNSNERDIIYYFFKDGGRGEIIQANINRQHDYYYEGIHILVKKAPKLFSSQLFLDQKAFNEFKNLINLNINVVLAPTGHNLHGSFASKHTSASKVFSRAINNTKTENYIMITPSASVGTIIHEKRHFYDFNKNLKAEFLSIVEAYEHGNALIPNYILNITWKYILEQRAYSEAFKYMRRPEVFKGKVTAEQISQGNKNFNHYYKKPLLNLLTFLEAKNKIEMKTELLYLIDKFTFKDPFLKLNP